MPRYLNLEGDSNIIAYRVQDDRIDVKFRSGAIYTYSYESAEAHHIENMIVLAKAGEGLQSYINRNVRFGYCDKRGTAR